jgi:uroporphyrin-III C-methyltransferase
MTSGPALAVAAERLVAPAFAPSSVWLVGAGPGDPGLLTLHAVHALASADVVLHDALVSPEILLLAGGARLECVGKRAGRPSPSQMRINERLIGLARQGLRVVRLKGGDPMVFGRGGEEALALAAAAVPFRIVPGISAGVGGLAGAAMPLTHRSLGRSVAFATGHDARGTLPDGTDWAALARGADVLVLYMALGQAGAIADKLIAAGRPASEPIAFVTDATTPRQQVRLATLGAAAVMAEQIPRAAATLIVVGPVVALRAMLAPWQDATPMTPRTAERRAPAQA